MNEKGRPNIFSRNYEYQASADEDRHDSTSLFEDMPFSCNSTANIQDFTENVIDSIKSDSFIQASKPFSSGKKGRDLAKSWNSLYHEEPTESFKFYDPVKLKKSRPAKIYQAPNQRRRQEEEKTETKSPRKSKKKTEKPRTLGLTGPAGGKKGPTKTEFNSPAVRVIIQVKEKYVSEMEIIGQIDRTTKAGFKLTSDDIETIMVNEELEKEARNYYFHPQTLAFIPYK